MRKHRIIADGDEFVFLENPRTGVNHIVPRGDEGHRRKDCPCEPTTYRRCTQCDGDDESCWLCGGYRVVEVEGGEEVRLRIVTHHRMGEGGSS